MNFFHQRVIKYILFPAARQTIVYCATRENKMYLASVKFDARAKRVNNHTSKINLFPVSHTMFFLLRGQKMDLFSAHGAIQSTL